MYLLMDQAGILFANAVQEPVILVWLFLLGPAANPTTDDEIKHPSKVNRIN